MNAPEHTDNIDLLNVCNVLEYAMVVTAIAAGLAEFRAALKDSPKRAS